MRSHDVFNLLNPEREFVVSVQAFGSENIRRMKIYFAGERKVVKINLKASSVVRFLSIIAIILITIHIIILFIYFIVNDPEKFDFVRLFDLDMETNIPTLFSSAILLISGFLFYLLSRISQEEGDGKTESINKSPFL